MQNETSGTLLSIVDKLEIGTHEKALFQTILLGSYV